MVEIICHLVLDRKKIEYTLMGDSCVGGSVVLVHIQIRITKYTKAKLLFIIKEKVWEVLPDLKIIFYACVYGWQETVFWIPNDFALKYVFLFDDTTPTLIENWANEKSIFTKLAFN